MTLKSMLATAGVLVALSMPAFARGNDGAGADPAAVKDVANHLSLFEEQAARVNRDADTLWGLSRNHGVSWQSHAAYLNNLQRDINEMGLLLAELEQMKSQANETQQAAIERVRPHLVALASETSDALELMNERSRRLGHPAYKDTISDLSRQAEIVYQTLNTLNDFHDTNERLQELEASHDGWGT